MWKEMRTYFVVESHDFDDYIKKYYGAKYESIAGNLWNRDSAYTFNDIKKEPIDKWDDTQLTKFVSGDKSALPSVYTFLIDNV